MATAKNGDLVAVHYRGTLSDGTEFDNSYDREQPLTFELGSGSVLPGFDKLVSTMEQGEKKNIVIKPQDAYGNINEAAIRTFPKTSFPENFQFEVGAFVEAKTQEGNPIPAKIADVLENDVLVDFNHPLAGKTLTFDVELVNIENQPSQ